MDGNAKARDPEEQAATTGQLSAFRYVHGREDWPGPRVKPYEPAQDKFDLPQDKVTGHRWDGWRRLTGDEGYFAARSRGWRSSETRYVSPIMQQVKEHVEDVTAIRGGRRSPRHNTGTGEG